MQFSRHCLPKCANHIHSQWDHTRSKFMNRFWYSLFGIRFDIFEAICRNFRKFRSTIYVFSRCFWPLPATFIFPYCKLHQIKIKFWKVVLCTQNNIQPIYWDHQYKQIYILSRLKVELKKVYLEIFWMIIVVRWNHIKQTLWYVILDYY